MTLSLRNLDSRFRGNDGQEIQSTEGKGTGQRLLEKPGILAERSKSSESGHLFRHESMPTLLALIVLLVIWATIILVVNPCGEFMVNDDWAFVRTLETFVSEGRLASTGWGPIWAPGGPSLITHLLWGRLFTFVGGFSMTTLRMSELVMAILGSVGLMVLLRISGSSGIQALWGSLALVFNPLFLALSFTFMSDVTLASMVVFSVLFLYMGLERSKTSLVFLGLIFALAAVLTRQIGIVIPIAFVFVVFMHPAGRNIGKWKALISAAIIVFLPWFLYEYFLYRTGSTPFYQHQVIQSILRHPSVLDFLNYLGFLVTRFVACGLTYVCCLVSTVLAMHYRQISSWKLFRYYFLALTAGLLVVEGALLASIVDLPVGFCRNVVFDFGIGPILLKDTYILEIQRSASIPKPLYYLLVYWTLLSMGACVGLICSSLGRFFKGYRQQDETQIAMLPSLCLVAALVYLMTIAVTGFHDRYLITACMLLIIWLVSDRAPDTEIGLGWKEAALALCPMIFLAWLSVSGIHDFMETKRSLKKAQDYLVEEVRVDPCKIDGGMEFNGYHCYSPDFQPEPGLSWWWVRQEDYVITLGPLPGFEVVRTFPFSRLVGPDGEIHVLRPIR